MQFRAESDVTTLLLMDLLGVCTGLALLDDRVTLLAAAFVLTPIGSPVLVVVGTDAVTVVEL